MNDHEIEQFILTYGCDILRFCRMTAGGSEAGDDLYQDTMLKLTEKKQTLLLGPHTKSYALSTALFLWKNSRRKYAARNRILPMESVEAPGRYRLAVSGLRPVSFPRSRSFCSKMNWRRYEVLLPLCLRNISCPFTCFILPICGSLK